MRRGQTPLLAGLPPSGDWLGDTHQAWGTGPCDPAPLLLFDHPRTSHPMTPQTVPLP